MSFDLIQGVDEIQSEGWSSNPVIRLSFSNPNIEFDEIRLMVDSQIRENMTPRDVPSINYGIEIDDAHNRCILAYITCEHDVVFYDLIHNIIPRLEYRFLTNEEENENLSNFTCSVECTTIEGVSEDEKAPVLESVVETNNQEIQELSDRLDSISAYIEKSGIMYYDVTLKAILEKLEETGLIKSQKAFLDTVTHTQH